MPNRVLRLARTTVRDILRAHAPVLLRHLTTFHLQEDRRLLESVIFPYFRDDPDVKRVLFVGCEWYTKPYESIFRSKEYWTLEIDPGKRRYGARRHIVDSLKNLGNHVPPDYFDTIFCNGVFFKSAIDTREEAEPSFRACRNSLRPGGWFVLGWDDVDEFRPYPPSESPELARFASAVFPPLGVNEYQTDTSIRHTYTFYTKHQEQRADATAAANR